MMKNFAAILTLLFFSCGTNKTGSSKKMNCIPAVLSSEFENNRIDGSNNHFELKYIDETSQLLKVEVAYSGGCSDHSFYMIKLDSTSKVKHQFEIIHESNGDNCRSWITDTLCFDLSTVKMKKGDSYFVKGIEKEFIAN